MDTSYHYNTMNSMSGSETSVFDRVQFNALANLLHFRDSGQVDPNSLLEGVPEDEGDHESDVASVDTTENDQITHSAHKRLKKKFLDCLAEFAANRKNGRSVSATAMKENEDSVTIWITRNEGFSQQDKTVFEKLGPILMELSKYASDETNRTKTEDTLWNQILEYHQDRIKKNYIPSLQLAFKQEENRAKRESMNRKHVVLAKQKANLRKLVFDAHMTRHAELAICAYDIRIAKSTQVENDLTAVAISERLWIEICMLARLRTGFKKFTETAFKLGSFGNVTIILRPHDEMTTKPPEGALNLKETLQLLNLSTSPKDLKAITGKAWTSRNKQAFAEAQKGKLQVHAEVQLLLFLCTDRAPEIGVFEYLGCSKLNCFLCASLIQHHETFESRGSHGRVFAQWTVPRPEDLAPGQCERLGKALAEVQKTVKEKLQPLKEHKLLQRTSAVGGSSIVTDQCPESSKRQSDINAWASKIEPERIAAVQRHASEAEQLELHDEPSRTGTIIDYVIAKPRCSLCTYPNYCSDSCRNQGFRYH